MIAQAQASVPAAPTEPLPYRIGEVGVILRSDLASVSAAFDELYRGYARGGVGASPPIQMRVSRLRNNVLKRDKYVIFGNNEMIGRERRREEVVPFLEWAINSRVIAGFSNFLQLHSACMVRDGHGLLLVGTSGSGKSTLVSGLLARGWKYLSDEFALIDRMTLRLHAFPKAICVKAGAFELIARLGLPFAGRRFYIKGIKGRVGYINPYDVARDPIAAPAPVRWVIFPKYAQGSRTRLMPLPRARAAFMLAGSTLNRDTFDDLGLSILTRVARKADCYTLESSSLTGSCDLVESLIDSRTHDDTQSAEAQNLAKETAPA